MTAYIVTASYLIILALGVIWHARRCQKYDAQRRQGDLRAYWDRRWHEMRTKRPAIAEANRKRQATKVHNAFLRDPLVREMGK